jgi:dGTPase
VTELALRRKDSTHGLDLTRATLAAILKYPRVHERGTSKYGVYTTERSTFEFARAATTMAGTTASIEAQIMDWADDITYCVHDIEDFYRAGRIPLDRLRANRRELGPLRCRATG